MARGQAPAPSAGASGFGKPSRRHRKKSRRPWVTLTAIIRPRLTPPTTERSAIASISGMVHAIQAIDRGLEEEIGRPDEREQAEEGANLFRDDKTLAALLGGLLHHRLLAKAPMTKRDRSPTLVIGASYVSMNGEVEERSMGPNTSVSPLTRR